MTKINKWIMRSLTAAILSAGLLLSFRVPAYAFDSNHCNSLFGAANVSKVATFKIEAGKVDFGDGPHLFGSPQGTAVVCWANDGRVAVEGSVYADSIRENVMAIVKMSFYNNGVLQARLTESVYGKFAASQLVNVVVSGTYDRVRVRLYNGNVTALGDGTNTLLKTRNFYR